MATPAVYKNVKVYSGGYDLSGYSNKAALSYEFDEVETIVFGDATHHGIPGLPKLGFELEGLASANATSTATWESDDILAARLGSATSQPMTFAPQTGADGEPAYFADSVLLKYAPGGAVGEAYAFSASGSGVDTALVRGTIMATGAKTSTSQGTARQLGAVTAAQKLYAVLHVFAVSGTSPTLDVLVKSDDAEGFSSGTTRITFTQKTAIGYQFATPVAGAITDDWWRIYWTIGGTDTPSFTFAVAVGIL